MIDAHADVVGSLLRPAYLLEARRDLAEGRLLPAEFKRIEDRAVDEAVRLQQEAGLPVVTDGEMRRLSFQSQMTEAVEGFGRHDLIAFTWGEWHGDPELGDLSVERPPDLSVMEKLRRQRSLSGEEFKYLRARTDRIAKVTLPSPSLWANFWSPRRSRDAYPTLEEFLLDVLRILQEEVAGLARLGCRYIQIDAPHYPLLLDPGMRSFYERRGWSADEWLARGIELDNALMADHPEVTFGLHLCRGNQGGRWLVAGDYGPIRELFRRTRAERLLLEYDDERSGSFEVLEGIPRDRIVVLGLVSTKRRRRETPEELEARVREAARYFPLERLALSPQCGFSTSILGSPLTPDDQAHKLHTVADVARAVWGE